MKALDEVFPFIPETHLFHSKEKADRFIRRRYDKVPRFIEAGAQTWCDGGVAVVLMTCEADWSTELALLCHEAYHIVSMHYGYLGEENPSEEFVAYGIQVVTKALFDAHEKWKGDAGRTEKVAKLEELLSDLHILCYPNSYEWEVTDHTYDKYSPCALCKKAHEGRSPCASTSKDLTEECCKPFQAKVVADRMRELGVEVD